MTGTPRRFLGRLRRLFERAATSYVLVLALAVVVGLQFAPAAWSLGVESGTEGTVAVVPLEGGISGGSATAVSEQLQRARQSPDVEAVVLRVDSPGGGAASSETLFMQVKQTSEQMPVVTSINALAASGGYYALAPTDYVYTKPASLVGSVGTIATLPGKIEPIDLIITTGPDKQRSGDERDWHYNLKAVQAGFLNAVVENRDLEMSTQELSRAKLYAGAVAVEKGLADETGGTEAAVRRAANMAGLDSYDVEVMRPDSEPVFLTRAAYLASDAPEKRLVEPVEFVGPPGEAPATARVYMLPGTVFNAAIERGDAANTTEVNNATLAG